MNELVPVIVFGVVALAGVIGLLVGYCELLKSKDESVVKLQEAFRIAHASAMATVDEYREVVRMRLEYKELERRITEIRNAVAEASGPSPLKKPQGIEDGDGISIVTPDASPE